uniref:Transmembrane protein 131 n=1 Tax=Sinocyclocheilus grahami TaxID=75366 RepID=A0A672M950_SINGR
MFVRNFSTPVLIPPHESRYIFSLLFRPVRPSIHIDSNILLISNASKFHLPVRAYTGFLEPVVLPPCLREHILDFGVLSATDTSSLVFVVVNSNPIELEIKSWLVTGDSLSMELLNTERGNRSIALSRTQELQNTSAAQYKTVILASGYYAAFKVTLVAKALEGIYDGAIHITTDYEVCVSSRKHCYLCSSFPQKWFVHQGFSIQSSFSQKVRLQQIRSLTEDVRFYFKRLRNNKVELEPRRKSKIANIYFDASLQCGDHCYVGLPFVLKSESRPHGLIMQEDIWDADVDLHQRLLKRWRELKEQSAFFEVNTDLQKNVQAKILAQLTWPSLVNSSQQIHFPLTNTDSSSEEEVILENSADVPVYVQVLPLALYPNPSVFTGRLADRFPLGKLSNINIDTNTLEFQVYKNHVMMKSSTGFVEGLTRPYVYNMLLMPGEVKSFNVRFRPITNHRVSSLLVVRNNLTVVDLIMVHGQGTTESLRLAGKAPGLGSSLRFKLTEAFLKDCSEGKSKAKEPNFTLRRTFRLENTGLLPIHIRSMEISGNACEGYGFKVLNCEEFALKPNTSKDLVILFTPDFTSSRVIRELKLVTAGGSVFVFVLNASLPYHMLAVCAETLPRPNWELELYIIVSLIMSSMFLLVIATAYLEAQGIWEPFKRRLSVESNSPMETGKPFDLREIVRIQSDANLNDFADSNQNSTRGMYGSSGGGRAGGRQGGPHSSSNSNGVLPDSKPKSGSGRSGSMQPSSSFPLNKDSGQGLSQLTNRKARSSKQQQQGSGLLEDLPSSGPSQSNSTRANSTEEQDYNRLLAAMDKDHDRPESPANNVSSEHNSQQPSQNKGKVKNKTKALKKKEEKERKTKGKTQGEDLKEPLADNDDSSSTTTETSNPDMEANIKERKSQNKLCLNFFLYSSLELPYVTPLEKQDKQRKTFTKTLANTGIHSVPKPRALSKSNGKMGDDRPSPLGKFVVNGSMQELGHSSGSEGEKESPPEWDVPLKTSNLDSLQQISMQTMHADPFLKGSSSVMSRACSPPPTSPSLVPRGSYGSVLHTSSEANLKKAPGNKLTKSASLPGQNGNPTFAAVAAGYDKSPGDSGLWSPIDTTSSPSFGPVNAFSAFGPNNPLNLSGGMQNV